MSFILDALKKSEAERLRRDSPGFANVPDTTRQKSAPPWIWIVAALVVINIGILAVFFMRPEGAADTVAATRSVEPEVQAPLQSEPAALPAAVAEPVTPQPAAATEPVRPAAIETARPEPAAPPPASPAVNESYSTFDELRAQGVLQLPDLRLDIHVHGPEPSDRFVFVNMSKYKERARLDEGPVVREITSEGVILEYRGVPFLLPRE